MVSPAAERGRAVRERLLHAAAELIPERGWTAVSTRILAERAGVTPSVVHYHFPSLPSLLNEAATGEMRKMLAGLNELLETTRSPGDAIETMAASVEQYTGADAASLLFVEAYLASTRDDALRERIAELVAEFRQRFGGWLERHGVPAPLETAAVLAACVDGLLLHRGLGLQASDPSAVLRRLLSTAPEEERQCEQ
ncbi:TetR/AcrR family transcriptional regulator [Nonomuraea sp. KC401]|uniref:TetR/AcrR family transcriptional regulator n=1 Tax=unclassified Nonomuraea TaxID=2593643 RepID=UPI0010FE7634|nr:MULTISPECIES: TetR/AcrR family transcriptional regulator [unclassified Nonomuraea]NBE93852.1 TetR family transcriptional regulator [Nonomuraea sp. K271]TLF68468.1 TetR/AcrR family transcriptional regulator [Nonomuraea sp. KC401]